MKLIALLVLLLTGCSMLDDSLQRNVKFESNCADGSNCTCEAALEKNTSTKDARLP